MNIKSCGWWVLLPAALSGCASIPDVTLRYFPTAWRASVTVTQTVGCVGKGTVPLALHTVAVAPSYFSKGPKPHEVRVADLDRWFADAEMTVAFTDDGRLKSVNQSATGQGEAIVKSAMTVLSSGALGPTLFGGKVSGLRHGGGKDAPTADALACRLIAEWGGDEPITLTYRASFDANQLGKRIPFEPTTASAALHGKLTAALPTLMLVTRAMKPVESGPRHNAGGSPDEVVPIVLQRMAVVGVEVLEDDTPIAGAGVLVPSDETYTLPMPKAALFGKQSFSLSLADSGAVLSIGYGKSTGAATALGALGTLGSAETTAYTTQAAALKAESDLIAQQQRAMLCRMKPSEC